MESRNKLKTKLLKKFETKNIFENYKIEYQKHENYNESINKSCKSLLFIKIIKYKEYINKNNKRQKNKSNSYLMKQFFENIIYFILFFFIFHNLFIYADSQKINDVFNRKLQGQNIIIITILGAGPQNILNPNFNTLPNQVLVNGEIIQTENTTINLIENINIISLLWESIINDCTEMFANLSNLIEVDFTNFFFSYIESMNYMFCNCSNLEKIIFNDNINTERLGFLEGTFFGCKSLKSLDLSMFDTSNVRTMSSMFYDCSSLTSLDLSTFVTRYVSYMENMFNGCNKLKYVDISNFDTSLTESMINLFYGCHNLIYINFTNFVEGSFTFIENIFEQVPENLKYCTDDEEKIAKIIGQLNVKICPINDCSNDWNKNQKKFIDDKNICVNECSEDQIYKLLYKYNNRCYKECPERTHLSIIDNVKLCLINCPEYLPFEKDNECYEICSAEDFLNKVCILNNETIEAKDYIVNEIRKQIFNININLFLNKDLSIIYEKERYQITTDEYQNEKEYTNNETTIDLGDCGNILRNYYQISPDKSLIIYKMDYYFDEFLIPITEYEVFHPLTMEKLSLDYCQDRIILMTKPVVIDENILYKYNPFSEYYNNSCFPSSSDCENKNILNERIFEFNNNMSLCEKNCIYLDYNTITKKVTCECKVKTSFSLISELYNNKQNLLFFLKFFNFTNEQNILESDIANFFSNDSIKGNISEITNMLESFLKNITFYKINNNLFDAFIDNILSLGKPDYSLKEENLNFQLMSLNKQNEYENISFIDLGDCEIKLKNINNIDINESLIIAKFDLFNSGYSIPKIEYDVYNPVNNKKLELDICNDTKIDIKIPVSINENELYKYNISSDYYNDFCFPYTTEKGTDIILNDRKNEFVNNNMSLCEDDCQNTKYDYDTKKVICKCGVKSKKSLINEIIINNDKILKNFINIKDKINLSIMKCFKLVFSIKGIKENIGSYVLLSILGSDIVITILFKLKGYANIINNIQLVKNNIESNLNNSKRNKSNEIKEKNKKMKEKKNEKTNKEKEKKKKRTKSKVSKSLLKKKKKKN